MKKNPTYQATGKDYSPGQNFQDADLDFNLPGPPAPPPLPDKNWVRGAGTPISKAAFAELQKRYNDVKTPDSTEFVSFSREAILNILSQYDCAGIKFYFVERMETKTHQLTLALVGVDSQNNDLSTASWAGLVSTSQDTLIAEAGNGWPPTI